MPPRYSYLGDPSQGTGLNFEQYLKRFLTNPNDQIFDAYRDFSGDAPANDRVAGEIRNALIGGPFHPSVYQYTDPEVKAFAEREIYNASLQDPNEGFLGNFLGDNFGPAVALLGLGVGGAAAAGGFSAASGAAAAPAAAGGFTAAGAEFAPFASTISGAFGPEAALAFGLPEAALLTTGPAFSAPAATGTGASIPLDVGLSAPASIPAGALGTGAGVSAPAAGILGTGITATDLLRTAPAVAGLVNTVVAQGNANDAADRAGDATDKANEALAIQSDIAKQLFESTGGLRGLSLAGLEEFQRTGELPTALQVGLQDVRTTGRQDIEQQYQAARQNLLQNIPARGGQLTKALLDLERRRADAVGRLNADVTTQVELPLRTSLYGRGTEVGFNQANNSLGVLTNLSGQQANLANIAAGQSNAANAQANAAGQAAGGLLALALKQATAPNVGYRSSTLAF